MRRLFISVSFCLFLLQWQPAHGQLIEWDAFDTGDSLAVKDLQSGLLWLDLSVTAGMSYQQAGAQFEGWSVASPAQVRTLFAHAFSEFTDNSGQGSQNNCYNGQACFAQASRFSALFGYVNHTFAPSFHYSFGLFESAPGMLQMAGTVVQSALHRANIYSDFYQVGYSGYYTASLYNLSVYLVNSSFRTSLSEDTRQIAVAVSEPGTVLLLLFLLLAFTLSGRARV